MLKGKKVWCKDASLSDTDVYVGGTCTADDGKQVTVETSNGTKAWPSDDVLQAMPETPESHKDHCNLEVLNDATLLHNTRRRFNEDNIYTYISEILLVVNPFKEIPGAYDDETLAKYKGGAWTKLDPHIFAVAEMSFVHMTTNTQSQSLLVAGESGAGKTETNKHLLQYLIYRASTVQGKETLAEEIMDTNPILEAFGNAKTVRNNNSSRFGKYLNMKFNSRYQVMGAEVRTFLLEKSRVTSANMKGERSYHAFYQLLKGSQAGGKGLSLLQGKQPSDFHYLSLSGTTYVDVIDDEKAFRELDKALESSISEEDRTVVYEVLGALLYLGNVTIEADGDSVKVGDSGKAPLEEATKLLGIGDLSQSLAEKVVKSPRSGNEIHIALDQKAAVAQRDALVKHIFNLLFDWLVVRMNNKIDVDKHFHKFIGLLDVFGFEVFETNSFEQLCINYANERLHHFFLMRVFEVEIELYRMQNLQVPPLSYPDNAKVIELLESAKQPLGIFPLLDSTGRLRNATDAAFCATLHKTHKGHVHFSTVSGSKMKGVKLKDEESFVVLHFAAPVCYAAEGFLEKNSDKLDDTFETALKKSTKSIVVRLVEGEKSKGEAKAGGGGNLTARGGMGTNRQLQRRMSKSALQATEKAAAKSVSESVGKKFLMQLKQLMREIATTHPFFVRCIKPNNTLKPNEFLPALVLRQLQCSGTCECVKLMQTGYPSRAPYRDLRARFKAYLPDFMDSMADDKFVGMLLMATGGKEGDYQLGQDMVFFKASKGVLLQDLMAMPKDDLASSIISGMKKAGQDMSSKEMKALADFVKKRAEEKAQALKDAQRAFLAAISLMHWLHWGENMSVVRHTAAVKMQAMTRANDARRQVQKMRQAKKAAEEAAAAAKKAAEEAEAARKAAAAAATAAAKKEAEEAQRKAEEAEKATKKAAEEAEAHQKAEEAAAKAAAEERQAADAANAAERSTAPQKVGVGGALQRRMSASNLDPHAGMSEDELAEAEHREKWFRDLPPGTKGAGGNTTYHRFLMCKGVEWGFQYHNFYGDWELSTDEPLCHERPHYIHNTMYGGYAHLFHVIDPHYHVPRWVIGPSPGNENGWAFCESDANTPWEVTTCWISWDGFEWHTCKSFKYVSKEHELDGLSDDEAESWEAAEAAEAEQDAYVQQLHDEEEAKAARKSTRKSEAKAAPKAEAKAAKVEEKKGGGKKEDGKKGGKKEEKKEKKKGGGFFGKKK